MTPDDLRRRWLALEHEAVWLYPLVGARVDSLVDTARDSLAAHLRTRDALLTRLRAEGDEPDPAALAYDVGPIDTEEQAQAAAQSVEDRIAATCLTIVGLTTGEERTAATDALLVAARATTTWGAPPRAFPGLP